MYMYIAFYVDCSLCVLVFNCLNFASDAMCMKKYSQESQQDLAHRVSYSTLYKSVRRACKVSEKKTLNFTYLATRIK